VFARKRNLMVEPLEQMGIVCPCPPQGTFYALGIGREPAGAPERRPKVSFRAALRRRNVTGSRAFLSTSIRAAPGPGASPYASWLRFSFGPPEANVRMGLEPPGWVMVREAGGKPGRSRRKQASIGPTARTASHGSRRKVICE
jgi:aspartate/methionine/tyrosine aminotransferase